MYKNDSLYQEKGNYLTSYTETDPTVPSHVKNIKTTDISKGVEWLIEDQYTTGQIISINGGWIII